MDVLTSPAPSQTVARAMRVYVLGSSLAVALLAISVLVGWLTGSEVLKSIVPGFVAMNPVTAVAFLFAAAALWLSAQNRWPRTRVFVRLLAASVVAIALLRLAGYMGLGDPGIDRLLFRARLDYETIPNRMAPNTAFAFLLLGGSILALGLQRAGGRRAVEAAWLVVLTISLITLGGYAYSADPLERVGHYIPMALPTAVGFALLTTGLLCTRPRDGIVAEFASAAVGGRMGRALLPAVVGIPLVLGWLRVEGERSGLYGTEVGVALNVTASILLLTGLLRWQARSLNRADAERVRNEERIAALNDELSARANDLQVLNDELEAFSYSVSHDLRAPLRSITSFSQALLEDCADQLDEQGRDHLDRVVRAGRRMATLIDDMLALARVTRKELRLEPVDLTGAAREVVDGLRQAEPLREVKVEIEPGLTATGDPQLLRVVLENLLGNAWKFTGKTPLPWIAFAAANGAENGNVYCVRDNGAGFDKEYAHKLFGVFQRLHSDAEFPGTGIGLATVQRIVRRHGGRVWAEGAAGEGAAFFFTL